MLLTVLVVIALAASSRFFLVRYLGNVPFANAVPAAGVAALILGSLSGPIFFAPSGSGLSAAAHVASFILSLGVGFVVLRFAAERGLDHPQGATAAASAVMIAFALGALWSRPAQVSVPVPSANTPAPATVPAEGIPMATTGSDTTSLCAASPLGSAPVSGHVDLFGVVRGDRAEPRTSPLALSGGDVVVFMGWATDDHVAAAARSACLIVDGKNARDAHMLYRLPRGDVAKAYHNPAVGETGFQIVVPAGRLPSGHHRLSVTVVTSNGKVGTLLQPFDVTVR
jgi:hypothetical protein